MDGRTNIGRRRAAKAKESSEFYQERQQAILRAAAQVFQEKGFHAATISHIAEKLGTDRASVYYYVSSKEELLQKMVRDATLRNLDAIEAVVASDRPARDKLREAFVLQMESYRTSYPYLHVFLQEKFPTASQDRSAWSKEIRKLSDRYFNAFVRIIEEGIASGEIVTSLPVKVTTQAALGMINWAHRWYRPEGDLPADRIGRGFADIVLNGLLAGPVRQERHITPGESAA